MSRVTSPHDNRFHISIRINDPAHRFHIQSVNLIDRSTLVYSSKLPAARFRSRPHRDGGGATEKGEKVRAPGIFSRCFVEKGFATEMLLIHVSNLQKINSKFFDS